MRYLFLVAMLVCSSVCYSGSETGTVRFVHGQYGSNDSSAGYTFFLLDGGVKQGNPACSTIANGERWVINNNWPAAKLQNSVLLAAAMSGKKVAVIGSNDCEVWGDTETARDIKLAE